MKAWIGIDVGASGAMVAMIEDGGIRIIRFQNSTEKEISDFCANLVFDYECNCFIEQVHAMPGQGVSSMFSFGESCGFIRGVLVATGIPFQMVTPQSWMKAMKIPKREIFRDPVSKKELPGSESKTDYKRRLKQKAEELFPHLKITNDVADALLIADYCKRIKTNTL